jgi:hypothetical protein
LWCSGRLDLLEKFAHEHPMDGAAQGRVHRPAGPTVTNGKCDCRS